MRADGAGWGAIAKELGFKLGELVSASNRSERSFAAREAAADRKAARATGKPERVARVDRPERPQRVDRPERPERPERPQKPDRGGRP